MKLFLRKDITLETTGLILQGVNCRGVMGAGLAKSIKNKWPIVYKQYKELDFNAPLLGTVQYVNINKGLVVANCFTQYYFGNDGKKYADAAATLQCIMDCFNFATTHNLVIKSPKIACGLGGLKWDDDVSLMFDQAIAEYPNITVTYFDF